VDWWLRNRGDLESRQDRDIERSCTSKDAYETEEHARAVAAMNGMADVLQHLPLHLLQELASHEAADVS
jgi:hypothetical protein